MTTLTTTPTYVAPWQSSKLEFGLQESGANFVRVWVTVAPEGSELEQELTKDRLARKQIYQGGGGAVSPHPISFDVGGKYTFVAQEYSRNPGTGGAYDGDPTGSGSETLLGSETTLTLYVGQRLVAPIGAGNDTARLVLYVWNDTIRKTTLQEHQEASPAVFAPEGTTPTPRAKAAMESATVVAALAALVDVAVATAVGDIAALISNFHTRWVAHVANSTVHDNADAANSLAAGLATASTPAAIQQFINTALTAMMGHFENNAGTGIDTGDYHNVGGKKNDWVNHPLIQSISSGAEAYAAFAELHRCYEAHRASTLVHNSPDGTALTALPLLLAVHHAFFAVLASSAPTPPPAQSAGAMTLIQTAGMQEEAA